MDRIDNVDLREALREIADSNTYFHLENDLNVCFDQLERAMQLDDPAEKMMLWVSYPSGIDCYSERQAFQQGTRDYNGVQFHGKNMKRDRKLISYILDTESGTSYKAAGWHKEADTRGHTWNTRGSKRTTSAPTCDKQRWAKLLKNGGNAYV